MISLTRRLLSKALASAVLVVGTALPAAAQDAAWQPDQPIRIIVPWAAGGATDAVIRVLAGAITDDLGVPVVVVNQTGARGTVGTKSVMDAPHDGTTWASGGIQDLGTYELQGLLETSLDDWHLFLILQNAPVLTVGEGTDFQTVEDVVAYMKEQPGELTVGTSGIPSTAYSAMQAFANHVGGEFRAVGYDGDSPTMVALVSGEVQATTQSGPGQAPMIKGKRVRPLAVLSDRPLEIEGYGTIPPVTDTYPDFNAPGITILVGVFLPKDTPQNVIDRIEQLWDETVANSDALKTYAEQNGSIFSPMYGEEAGALAKAAVAETAWRMYEDGTTAVSPETLGIARP
jgi:tripartite-type tricarboxylate transporter receptor subunit TctC